jgi:hypothetical protein
MIQNYAQVYGTPLPEGYRLIENEQTFIVPVPGTEHCECNIDNVEPCCTRDGGWGNTQCGCLGNCPLGCSRPHYLEGTIDALIADERNNTFPYECKTYIRKPTQPLLDMSFQFTAYLWLMAQPTVNMPALSMLFDGLFKKAGVTKGKTLEDNFLRKLLSRSPYELETFGQRITPLINEMANPSYIDITVPYLHGGCWDCSFVPLCNAITRHEDTSLVGAMYVKHDHKLWSRNRKLWEDKGD